MRWHITKDNQLKKEFVPYIYDVQKKKWVSKFPTPRPLYNLSELALRPDSPVLIVEGEKTADAAKLFPDYVVVTSSGRCKIG